MSSSERAHALLEPDLVDELHLLPYPLTLGGGKRLLPADVHATFALQSLCPYPAGVVGLHYARRRRRTRTATSGWREHGDATILLYSH